MPKRVQRKRTAGWKMPLNTIYVGRPTIWGNPFKMTRTDDPHPCSREEAIERYEQWLEGELKDRPNMLDPLKGKDLACWCPLKDKHGNPVSCHADVILKMLDWKAASVVV